MQHVAAASAQQAVASRHGEVAKVTRSSTTAAGCGRATSVRVSRTSSVRNAGAAEGGGGFSGIAALALAEKKKGNKLVSMVPNANVEVSTPEKTPVKKFPWQREPKPPPSPKIDEEDDDEEEEKLPRCIIMPDSNFRAC